MQKKHKNEQPLQLLSSTKKVLVFAYVFILLFSFLSKVIRLSDPTTQYFDEVYHGFTATRYLHNDRNAYDIWARPPEGKAYEWTHPPFAKLAMTASMVVFGENSFGWRFGSVLFGTAAIGMTMLLAFRLFKSHAVSLLAGLLLCFDGLVFVQSRIAMNDPYFLFFLLSCIYSFLIWIDTKNTWALLASSVAFGLGIASKWTMLYGGAIVGVIILWNWIKAKKIPALGEIVKLGIAFCVIPTLIYIASYTQFFQLGFQWSDFTELQRQMWWYHTNLKATHSYQSRPWQWILDLRPVWMYVDYSQEGKVANIYNLGNPIIFYGGFISILYFVYAFLRTKWKAFGIVILCYFIMWLPWMFSPRIMFFYHYTPAVPMLCISFAYILTRLWKKENGAQLVLLLLTLAIGWFVLFYPHLTALHMPKEFVDTVYYPIKSWK